MYQTYILYSSKADTYYTGSTGVGVEKRLERHNEGWSRSTKSGIPWVLKHVQGFDSKTEAPQRVKHIKRQKSRANIEEQIHSEENEYIYSNE